MKAPVVIMILTASAAATVSRAETEEQAIRRWQERGKRAGWTFAVGRTAVSNVPVEQYYHLTPSLADTTPHIIPDDDDALPVKWDWRDLGVVTPIRDQAKPQYCGSCWAHGTAAAFESAIAIKSGRLVSISPQQLVSCEPSYGSCDGGNFAFGFYEKVGANHEDEFPYKASDVDCRKAPEHEKAASWGMIGERGREPTTLEIKRAIYEYGPVAVTVSASGAWSYYKGGVYNECNNGRTNHIVALVGWDDADQVWLLKNSHGTDWGEKGYMRIKYVGDDGQKCNSVGEEAAFVRY